MGNIRILLIVIFLSLFGVEVSAQENPFMKFVGKKYAEKSKEFFDYNQEFAEFQDTIEARAMIAQVEEVAQQTGSMEWILLTEYLELELFTKKWLLYGKTNFSVENSIEMGFELLEKLEAWKITYLELLVRQRIIDHYWNELKNYELAFQQYAIQEERLNNISSKDIPTKANYLLNIADAHYFFKDYGKSIRYYEKVLEDRTNVHVPFLQQHARNGMGLCYRFGYNDFDRSDSCFSITMLPENVANPESDYDREIWEGIGSGNIGHNMMLRGEYDQAIPLLINSIEKMLKWDDFGYATGPAINLANIYLKKGNISKAKHYLDLALHCYEITPRVGMLSRIFEAQSKYYAATGNTKLSIAYMDSTLKEIKRHDDEYCALQLVRAEQRQHIVEYELKETQLKSEIIKKNGYRISLIVFIIALLMASGFAVHNSILHRKQKDAYRELVHKSKAWAHVKFTTNDDEMPDVTEDYDDQPVEEEPITPDSTPTEIDLSIMKEIETVMTEKQAYLTTTLTVESLAQMLNAKKHYVSSAINRCTRNNFNTFVNEYRIKEAVRLLSNKQFTTNFNMDGIAFELGFTDRKIFYRVFKKMTGLSPTEFINNANE